MEKQATLSVVIVPLRDRIVLPHPPSPPMSMCNKICLSVFQLLLVICLVQDKSSYKSDEDISRQRRLQSARLGSENDSSFVTTSKLSEIKEKIRKDLQEMKEENSRVCRTALGAVRCSLFSCVIIKILILLSSSSPPPLSSTSEIGYGR